MFIQNSYRFASAVADARFMMKLQTVTSSEMFTLGIGGGTFNYTVDWGDGSSLETYTTGANISHVYSTIGEYIMKINGQCPHIAMAFAPGGANRNIPRDIINWGSQQWGSFFYFMWQCPNVTVTALDYPDLSNASTLRNSFRGCSVLDIVNINNWDFSTITNINDMFTDTNFNRSLGGIDMNQITNFGTINNLDTTNYDSTLIGWASQTPLTNRSVSFGSSQYTLGGSAESARNTLINTYGWTITDGGGI